MDIVKAMTLFVRVVDTGSLTAAAAECGLSPTMVGNHLQALEERLGTRLINRTTRRQNVTEFGKAYYDRCMEILGLVEDADALAAETQASPRGRLRITASATFGTECLVPALAEYTRRYPQVHLDLAITDAVVDLAEDGYEAAIRLGTPHGPDLVARPLAPYRLAICASPAYLAARGVPLHPPDLAAHDCLPYTYSARSEWRSAQAAWRMTGPEGELSVPISGRVQIDSAQALRQAALAGMGIVMLPEIMVARDMEGGQLVRVLPAYAAPVRPLNLIYLRDRRMSLKLRSFVDFVVERFGVIP
ncbi:MULTISPECIES: LysR family transcriptional regulator [unclassified Duganella]|uniref:LysR family transcriptional regulator n=1 Tax=unclassified Duganella TaxID=2636909 RepID=UPI000E34AF4B|nr:MULTISPECIES: LysR family transcriptional regulator [unclassified Duganella]RFP15827.1 LysR family transcriptional regulator [Duganella sp. BJB475]RFP33008.1 LysR family transcriptional regulator [Duganella sp. BJB476]